MNIPPKYEDVVAELEVLREGTIALNPESVLKQEADYLDQIADLQKRLTVAEQGLKTIIKRCQAGWSVEAIELEAEEVLEDIALNGQS